MSGSYQATGPVGRFVDKFEETAIATLLGLMTLLTFTNVILRYAFNNSIIWSLEVVLVMFAWLVLFGISYGFKVTAHLGVDAVTSLFSRPVQKTIALVAGVLCIVYGGLILKGSWDYWAPFADLPPTSGRWFPTGMDYAARGRSFFETDQIPMPNALRFLEDWINYGERYSKMPRMIPYTILPIGAALLLFRILQAVGRVWTGQSASLIVSHEAEEAVKEASALNKEA